MKKIIRKLFKLAVLIVAVLAVAGLLYRWFGHRAFQSSIADLRAKGEKLTFQELSTPVSTNAAGCLAAITNTGPAIALPSGKGIVDGVNLVPFAEAGRARVAWIAENPRWVVTDKGAVVLSWNEISNYVAQVGPSLAELRTAIKDPAANAGLPEDAFPPSIVVSERQMANRLAIAALADLHFGRRAEALANVQAVGSLAAFNRDACNLTVQMTRVALIDFGVELTWQALQAADWSNEQLLDLQHSWQNLSPLEALEKGACGRRAHILQIPVTMAENDTKYPSGAPVTQILQWAGARSKSFLVDGTIVENDLAYGLRHAHSEVVLARSLRTNATWRDVRDSFQTLNSRLTKRKHFPQNNLYPFALLLLDVDMRQSALTAVHTEIKRRMALTSIGLRRYKVKQGRYPPTLESIVPEYLPAVPIDCMNGRPLHYQANGDGTFTLYSVGDDGRDNGGDPSSPPGVQPGLWEGRDAVWPWPAK